ncbi:MAG TPA: hypothetical protein VN765_10690 [Candidatus Acidoferrum sp.]|nr:hypothetical protein [Candidatus Acidoferrum sp.]
MRKPVLFMVGALLLAQAAGRTVCRAADGPAPQPYTRVANPDSNTVQLQIALRKFVPAQGAGPAVWLAGVMHVGEPAYYHALQEFLNAQTVVLYEGINPGAHPHHVGDGTAAGTNEAGDGHRPPLQPPAGTNSDYSMQSALARCLGLVFQLEAIDYDRTNFLNSDLSILQIQRIMAGGWTPAAPGEGGRGNASFETLLQIMDGSSFLGSLFKVGMEIVGSSPELQGVAKLTLIEAVGRLKGDLTDLQGMPPDWKRLIQVLIAARNQHLLADLSAELKKIPPNGSIAVFYGAGHMDDLEKRLTGDLHYRPAEEKWLGAFSVDLRKSGISPFAAHWLRSIVQEEMEQMQPH